MGYTLDTSLSPRACIVSIREPASGGHYTVIHHTEFLAELIANGRLPPNTAAEGLTFHDPCYLGRQNGVVEAPREALSAGGYRVSEMAQAGQGSFCCGAGGGQMWKEEEHGETRVSLRRLEQARATGAQTVAVGCPFCLIMLGDAAKEAGTEIAVRDVVELIADRLPGGPTA